MPVKEGGVGVRELGEVQRSLFLKFGRQLLTQDLLWVKIFWVKYVKNGHHVLSLEGKSGSLF